MYDIQGMTQITIKNKVIHANNASIYTTTEKNQQKHTIFMINILFHSLIPYLQQNLLKNTIKIK